MSWSRKFFDPIILPDGRKLVTLKDAGEYIQALPAAQQKAEAWQAATQALLLVVNGNGDPMLARIGMMLALYPLGEPVFDKSRKDPHWGKRKLKLKRDQ